MTAGARVAIVTGATGANGSAIGRRDAAWITGQVIAVDGGLSGVKLPLVV